MLRKTQTWKKREKRDIEKAKEGDGHRWKKGFFGLSRRIFFRAELRGGWLVFD